MIGKLAKRIIKKFMTIFGYSEYVSAVLLKELKKDLFETNINFQKKLWAYQRGFFGRRINEYGLTDSNYKDYENDFHYYQLHPLNEYAKWIDDKLTFRYVLQSFSEYLPKYYFELRDGKVLKLMDCPVEFSSDRLSVVSLLEREKQLAVKPLADTGGRGFYKLATSGGNYLVNDQLMNAIELKRFLVSLNRYLVTEYLASHENIRKIWNEAPNTLRIMAVHNEGEDPVIVGAYIRFGTSSTGTVDNINAGGIACGIDISNGRLYNPKRHEKNAWIDTPVHMDTKVKMEGDIPHWDMVIKKLVEICHYVPQLRYMSFDVIITAKEFRIIEINSHGDIYTMQIYYPLLQNKHVKYLFYKNNVKKVANQL